MGDVAVVHFRDFDLDTIRNGFSLEQVKEVMFDKFLESLSPKKIQTKKQFKFCYIGDEYEIILNKEDCISMLNELLQYYESHETYEKCIEIKKLIDAGNG